VRLSFLNKHSYLSIEHEEKEKIEKLIFILIDQINDIQFNRKVKGN
jgi:hypothetical protein